MISNIFFKLNIRPALSETPLTTEEYSEMEFRTAKELSEKFKSQVSFVNKNVLDLGCGLGGQTVYFSKLNTLRSVGVDINTKWIREAKNFSKKKRVSTKVDFVIGDAANLPLKKNVFDIIVAYDVMEHLPQAEKALKECERVIKPDGVLYVVFGPPWLNPCGAHLWDYIPIPWCHLLFSERTLVNVARVRAKDKSSLSPIIEIEHEIAVFQNLAKMTLRKFKKIISKTGFKIVYLKEEYIKKISFLRYLPFIKEFFISKITCILKARRWT